MKKLIKVTIYILFNFLIILLTTSFLRATLKNYEDSLLIGIQYYLRIVSALIIYAFSFIHITLLIFEYRSKKIHSIWWEAISLVILFTAIIANVI